MGIVYNLKYPIQICERHKKEVEKLFNTYMNLYNSEESEEVVEENRLWVVPLINAAVNDLVSSTTNLRNLSESSVALARV